MLTLSIKVHKHANHTKVTKCLPIVGILEATNKLEQILINLLNLAEKLLWYTNFIKPRYHTSSFISFLTYPRHHKCCSSMCRHKPPHWSRCTLCYRWRHSRPGHELHMIVHRNNNYHTVKEMIVQILYLK